jgi:putative flippase GtrA
MRVPQPIESAYLRLHQAWRERAIALKAVSFAMVGAVNTVVDASIFFLAYFFLTSSLIVANVMSWTVGITCSYVLNSLITFAAESGRQLGLRSYGTFVASGVAGVVASTTALVLAAQFMPVLPAKACAILVSFVVNFSMSNFVVFRQRRQTP